MRVVAKNCQENQIPEIELTYKYRVNPMALAKILSAEDAYEVLLSGWDLSRIDLIEQFKVLLINRSNRLLGVYEVSSGGIAGTIADPKLIFAAAIKSAASGIILAHNHPSGDPTPSLEDVELTRKLKAGAEVLEIEMIDHLVITREGWVSMKGEGWI